MHPSGMLRTHQQQQQQHHQQKTYATTLSLAPNFLMRGVGTRGDGSGGARGRGRGKATRMHLSD